MRKKVILLTAASLWAATSLALAEDSAPAPTPSVNPPAATPLPPPRTDPTPPDASLAPVPDAPTTPPAAVPAPAIPRAPKAKRAPRNALPAPPPMVAPPTALEDTAPAGADPFVAPRPPRPAKTPEGYVRRLQNVIEKTSDAELDEENEDTLGTGMMDEERDLDVDKAMKRYQAVIARFDRQRSEAAQATFHLAECYRKLGRMEEAKAQYGRVLREFADQAELVRASERYLFRPTVHTVRGVAAPMPPGAEVSRTVKSARTSSGGGGGFGGGGGNFGGGGGVTGGGVGGGSGKVSGEYFFTVGEGEEAAEADAGGGKAGGKQTRRARVNVRDTAGEAGGNGPDLASQLEMEQQGMKRMQEQLDRLQQLKAAGLAVPLPPGYGVSGSFGKSLGFSRSSALQQGLMEAQTDLDLAKANLRGVQKQAKEWRTKLQAITSAKAEHLPPPADADLQYAKLREEYTEGLLHQPGDSKEVQAAFEKIQAEVHKKLQDYVEKVYQPAVEASVRFAERQIEEARMEVDQARAKVDALRGKMEKTLKEAAETEAVEGGIKPPMWAPQPDEAPRK